MTTTPIVFYLHGMIVETQGASARHPEYGQYEYENILETFREKGFRVISEIRPENTDVEAYADKIVSQIDSLLKDGISPQMITVIGASKGSMIAMVTSTKLQNELINFVFMAACNEWVKENLRLNLCGRILSVYEASDDIGKSCRDIMNDSECHGEFKELELSTGRKHGFIFSPLAEWVDPSVLWIRSAFAIEE